MMTDNLNHKQDSKSVSSSFVGAKYKNLKVGLATGDDENAKSAEMLYKFKGSRQLKRLFSKNSKQNFVNILLAIIESKFAFFKV